MSLFHASGVLLLGALSSQLGAQTVLPPQHAVQGASAGAHKAKPAQSRPAARPSTQARQDADLTARLQAQAIAAAAARSAGRTPQTPVTNLTRASTPTERPALAPAGLGSESPMVMLPSASAVIVAPAAPSLAVPSSPAPLAPAMPTLPVVSEVSSMPPTSNLPPLVQAAAPPSAPMPSTAATGVAGMGPEEMAIAQRIHQGLMPCELGTSVRVEADAARPGYFRVMGKGFRYRMHPVRTSTGALRLEDAQAGAVWLQLANKSMLMDQKKGRRMADECAHPEQVAFAQDMKNNPPPMLFDTQGMGRSKD